LSDAGLAGLGESPLDPDPLSVAEVAPPPASAPESEPESEPEPEPEPEPEAEPLSAAADAAFEAERAAELRSFLAQPLPLKWIVGAEKALRTGDAPQIGQLSGASAVTDWRTSKRWPFGQM
jgi:hypothetical protein